MNYFEYLDGLFPCGDARTSGEVVHIYASLTCNGVPLQRAAKCKREAQYVNASVNARHLHRSLATQVRDACLASSIQTTRSSRALQRRGLLALVAWCYEENYRSGFRWYDVVFDVATGDWYF